MWTITVPLGLPYLSTESCFTQTQNPQNGDEEQVRAISGIDRASE